MTVTVETMQEDREWLQKQSRKFGGIIATIFVGAVKRGKNRLAKVVANGGGLYGVPTFAPRSPITLRLHGKRWGGNLPRKSLIKYWRGPGGKQIIGFPDNNPATVAFGTSLQTSTVRPFSVEEQRFFKKIGIREMPGYSRPARAVIDVFAEANYPELLHDTRVKTEKVLNDAAKLQAMQAKIRERLLKQQARKR